MRKSCKEFIEASVFGDDDDPRPFVRIKVGKEMVFGLLDSGASISALGQGAEELLERNGLKWTKVRSNVKTADGIQQQIIGKMALEIQYNGRTEVMTFFIVPSLKQPLYLGVDFWRKFKIAPQIISEITPPERSDPNMHQLSSEQTSQLNQIVKTFPSFEQQGLGRTKITEHFIDTGEATPVRQKCYPVSPAIQKQMFAEIDRMVEMGVLEESDSEWRSPVVLVRKPNKVRLCLDSRKLNEVTKKDAFLMPDIDGLLSRLGDTYFISSVDLKDAFLQIPLEETSKEKTAFAVPGRPLYHFKTMPFGLCNAAQRMCRLMEKVIPECLRQSIFVYLDDLLIISATFSEHLELLKSLAKCLSQANLTINVQKSKFCFKELRYLGYIVGDGSLKTDPEKVAAIRDFPAPRTTKQVRRFLGLTGWYRRFIKNFAELSAPLSDTLKKTTKFTFTPEANDAFERLKKALTEAPLLTHPDFNKHFYLQCDASSTGVGSVLFQKDSEGHEKPLAYMSKKLDARQRNYSVTELECYAAVLSVKKFRAYVEGHPFTIITDHASLKWLMGQRDLSGRLARWSLKLQAYDFSIEYRKGTQNVVPDALSRAYMDELDNELTPPDVDLTAKEFQEEEYAQQRLQFEAEPGRYPDIRLVDGIIYVKKQFSTGDTTLDEQAWKVWIPKLMTRSLIDNAHNPPNCAHGGINKTLHRLREKYFWPGMAKEVKQVVKECETCKTTKPSNQILRPLMGNQVVTERPFQRLFIDFLGPYPRSKAGNTVIFLVVDHLSKFVFIKPLRDAKGHRMISYLEQEVFHLVGTPEYVHSDNGQQFRSAQFANLLKVYGVNHVRTAIYSPQSNSSERVNRSIIAAIRAYISPEQTDWDKNLSKIACAIRSSTHEAIKTNPYYALFGHNMVLHGTTYPLLKKLDCLTDDEFKILPAKDRLKFIRDELQRNLQQAYEKGKRTYNSRARAVSYRVGQEIFRKNFQQSNAARNFNVKFARSYKKGRITKRLGNCMYEVEDLAGNSVGIYHAKDLKQ